jgi:hypothetical protein
MNTAQDIDRFVKDPSLLVDLCHEVFDRIETRDADKTVAMETQLREISKTVDKLESLDVAVPDVLRAEKIRLVAELAPHSATVQQLNGLVREIEKILTDLKARLGQGGDQPFDGRKHKKHSLAPKTDSETLRKHIIMALTKLGGKAPVADILEEMEGQLKGSLLPGDLVILKDGKTVTWRNKAQWERLRMVEDGVLHNDSPHGIWELKVERQ